MNKPNNMKNRQRGRNGKQRPPGRNPNFDGNNARPRGNAQQLMEKYLSLARDATSAGDRVLAENYFQHADHYYRVLNARFEQQGGQRQFQDNGGQDRPNYDRQGYGQDRPYEGGDQPRQDQNQPQMDPQPRNFQGSGQPQSAPASSENEIGLPPNLLGMGGSGDPGQGTADDHGSGSDQQDEGHSQGRRRRGRGDRPFNGPPGE